MCGIFGIRVATGITPDRANLEASARLLQHRGPDASIVHNEPGLGLAHTRLSLVDTEARSNQPFWDIERRYCLVFNGEIYNFRELRSELEANGCVFRTSSDTEVLLQMLIYYGAPATLPRLEGMFGFAFIDREAGTLLLARDRFGMKPVFYAESSDSFMFASEVKAFRPWQTLEPNLSSISAYLMKFGGPTKGSSFYKGVHGLAPGHMLTLGIDGIAEISPFFQAHDFLDAEEYERLKGRSNQQIVDEFEGLMGDAVESHAFADATVGAFCSGGVDSSLIVSLAAKKTKDVQLFHANIKGSWSEIEPAKALAKHLGLDLNVVDVDEQSFVDSIPKVMRHYEYPYTYHPNCAPLMTIAERARDLGVKGLLSGEGSDELFLGYPWLGRKRLTDVYDQMTEGMGHLIRKIPGIGSILLPDRSGNFAAVRDILNGREILDDLNEVSEAIARHPHAQSDPKIRWTLDYMNHHLRTLLLRNDTMGMAASIEARFPFLDNNLAKFGVNLPGRHKLRVSPFVFEKAHPFVRDKWVVRAAADRYIPKNLSQRIKIGFWTTVFQRLEIEEALFETSRLGDLLNLSKRQLRDLASESSSDLKLRLLHLDVWTRVCIDGEPDDISISRLKDHVTIRPDGRRAKSSSPKSTTKAYPSAPT